MAALNSCACAFKGPGQQTAGAPLPVPPPTHPPTTAHFAFFVDCFACRQEANTAFKIRAVVEGTLPDALHKIPIEKRFTKAYVREVGGGGWVGWWVAA
jgi:hypothetical protein